MTSNLNHTKDYTKLGECYQLVLPLSLEGLVPEDDSVRLLSHILEELDYTKLYQAYSTLGRNPAPDHSIIARFRTGFASEAIEDLFYQFVRKLAEKLGFRYPSITADSEYESEEGYTHLKTNKQTDTYTCHAGKQLKPIFIRKQKSKNQYESEVTVYERESCEGCPYKSKCTKAAGNKRFQVSKKFIALRQESYENILSETGIKYRMNRSIQVEGAFGVLKNDYGFPKFLFRGKTKVKLEILLLCFGYNINKLHAKIQNNRTKSHMFPIKTA